MEDGGSDLAYWEQYLMDDDDYGDDILIGTDMFGDILVTTDSTQSQQENYSSFSNVPQGLSKLEQPPALGVELPGSFAFSSSYHSESSNCTAGVSYNSLQSAGNSVFFDSAKSEPSLQIGSPLHSRLASLTEWIPSVPGYGHFCADRDGVNHNASSCSLDDSNDPQYITSSSSNIFGFSLGNANQVSNKKETFDYHSMKVETEYPLRCFKGNAYPEHSSQSQLIEKSHIDYGKHCGSIEYSLKTLESPSIEEISFIDIDIPGIDETDDGSSSVQYCSRTNNSFYSGSLNQIFPNSFVQSMPINNENTINMRDEGGLALLPIQNSTLNNVSDAQLGRMGEAVIEALRTGNSDVSEHKVKCESGYYISPKSDNRSYEANDMLTVDKALINLLHDTPSNFLSTRQVVYVKDETNDELVSVQSMTQRSFEVDSMVGRMPSGVADGLSADKVLRQSFSGVPTRVADDPSLDVKVPVQSCVLPSTSIRKKIRDIKEERKTKLTQPNSTDSRSHVDDDLDVCILEDMSVSTRINPSPVNATSLVTSQGATIVDPPNPVGVGAARPRTNDERFIFRVALQDLSQPRSEAIPPAGVLAVPLLRHQRIALSWMVHKEAVSLHCSGGILADDQGLGKTISTIALILTERSPSSKVCGTTDAKQTEAVTLNLDEDDDESENGGSKQTESCQVNGSATNGRSTSVLGKCRPAAGTLVVCPTTVLRQWSDELHNRVTSKANLSVLVYHGSNRTKDPFELANYDVVVTTYSIVSMEVPKQPLVDDDDDETGKHGQFPPMGLSSSKKRKYPPSCDKRSLKSKKGSDSDSLEPAARPLARVRWFRVVLDEAQSIKNHRTKVARACWGLRAKRRWCLSGTPIQNAVDDLYSYFRFLRYDPYAVYTSFCSTIKAPIQRSPTKGYRKLQAVLKTIMLRRTKGTLLDGKPIITLPPKTIELKKVDFTKEERDFYCRLEADSRAQFAEYAAAGTVKQNYVNILLLLLRLRQACDHPLLVREYNSNSVWKSSVEMAKKLPREKQICLLNCLEASLAICGICNDPPEDSAVTSCGHVFCNQCISEHLTGDDHQCPTRNCKAQLSASSVFSRASLRSSISENTPDSFGSELASEPRSSGCPLDSSKIKAALEVLQSLSKPQGCGSRTSSSVTVDEGASSENSSNSLSGRFQRDMHDSKSLGIDRASGDLVTVRGEKAIVFSQWTRMLDLLEDCLKSSSITYRRLDGTMTVVAKDRAVKDFNSLPEVSVMIMSLKAASLGLNMVAACHVLLLDLWWNPTTEDQAIDRAHRIGQTRPVSVLRLTVKDTVEDRILALQQKKRKMVASAFGEDERGSRQTRLTEDDLKYLFMV